MQYKTHFVTSLAVALPVMAATDTLTLGSVLALGLGAVFPDVDEPHSWIGCRTRGFSDFINKAFGHRGITHSLFGLLLVFLTIVLLINLSSFPVMLGFYFVIGYALHLIEDSFSKSGVKWLLPFSDKKIQSGFGIYYYKTGSLVEKLIFASAVIIVGVEIQALDFGSIKFLDLNFPKTLIDFSSSIANFIRNV